MTASTHLAVGAVVGLTTQRFLSSDASDPEKLFWAFVAGFASHLVLDAFPHQEYHLSDAKLGLVLFVEITAILILFLSARNSLLVNAIIFFGMAGGALPDVIDLVHAHIVSWPWLGWLGSKIHFCHGVVPTRHVVSFYFQSLITLAAVILVKLKL